MPNIHPIVSLFRYWAFAARHSFLAFALWAFCLTAFAIEENEPATVQRNLNAMNEVTAQARRELQRAHEGIRLAAPLLLLEARNRGVTDHRAFALAAIQMAQRRQAHSLIEQGLRLEELKINRE